MHDEFVALPLPKTPLFRCHVCGTRPALYQRQLQPGGPASKAVVCANSRPIVPNDDGEPDCPLYLPPEAFWRATVREAVTYWNAFAQAAAHLRINGGGSPEPKTPLDWSNQK